MDTAIATTITGLLTNSKIIADLVLTIADKSKRNELEAVKALIDLARAQLEAVAQERDKMKRANEDLRAENKDLAERVAYLELSLDYDIKQGLLYKKGTGEGPYCQVDRYQMTLNGQFCEKNMWECPKCGGKAMTIDPDLAG